MNGTIIGLEGRRADKHIINTNYTKIRNELQSQDLKAVFQIDVTMWGYIDGGPHSFTCRDAFPYMLSISANLFQLVTFSSCF